VEEDAEVRGGIALALASFEDPALTGTLAALLDDPSEGVRRLALRGLSKLDDPRVLEVAPILYSSGGWLARQEALDALARLGTPEAGTALETLLTAERRWRGRRAIRKALRRCGEGWDGRAAPPRS
jgi:HEAT repeat protein